MPFGRRRPAVTADPRWITVKYACRCGSCQAPIKPGQKGFYWPASKSVDCATCGEQSANDFSAAVQDEKLFLSQYARPF